jgi:hypothetical protein
MALHAAGCRARPLRCRGGGAESARRAARAAPPLHAAPPRRGLAAAPQAPRRLGCGGRLAAFASDEYSEAAGSPGEQDESYGARARGAAPGAARRRQLRGAAAPRGAAWPAPAGR